MFINSWALGIGHTNAEFSRSWSLFGAGITSAEGHSTVNRYYILDRFLLNVVWLRGLFFLIFSVLWVLIFVRLMG